MDAPRHPPPIHSVSDLPSSANFGLDVFEPTESTEHVLAHVRKDQPAAPELRPMLH